MTSQDPIHRPLRAAVRRGACSSGAAASAVLDERGKTAASNVSAGRTIVAGLGRTGLSCARHLTARGIAFAVTDSRPAPPEAAALMHLAPRAQTCFGAFDESLLEGAAQVIASPGISLAEPFLVEARRRGIPVIGDIELFAREARAPIVAITGTNGKSTVTTLVALMAQASGRRALAGGNLGRPALDLLEEPVPDVYVLELSSFQLETTHDLGAAVAAVLNVSPDHLDRYASLSQYAAAKARIFERSGAAIVNLDDAVVRAMPLAAQASAFPSVVLPRMSGFSLHAAAGADYHVGTRRVVGADPRRQAPVADRSLEVMGGEECALMCRDDVLATMSELKIAGLHNAANALAALAICDALGLPREDCLSALRAFPGLPHRSQWVAERGGVRYVDDSKGTNVGATLAAVAGHSGSLVLIAGGQGKGQDFTPLAAAFAGKVRHAVLIGQDARTLAAALGGVTTLQFAADMREAVRLAAQAARAGETVLLSPACASLDMFRDYGHRGDVFAAAVRELPA